MSDEPNITPIGREIHARLDEMDVTQKKFCEKNNIVRSTLNGLITGKIKKLNSKHIEFLERGFGTEEGYWDKYKSYKNGMSGDENLGKQATLMAKFARESGYKLLVAPRTGAIAWVPGDASADEVAETLAGLDKYTEFLPPENA